MQNVGYGIAFARIDSTDSNSNGKFRLVHMSSILLVSITNLSLKLTVVSILATQKIDCVTNI